MYSYFDLPNHLEVIATLATKIMERYRSMLQALFIHSPKS